jgi:hypothetical protein
LTKAIIFCNNNKFLVIATLSFRFGMSCQIAGLVLFICYFKACGGLAADAVAPALKGLVLEAIVAGDDLDAAEAAAFFQGVSSGNKMSKERRWQPPVRRERNQARKGKADCRTFC